ncbi:ras-related protein Rab-8B-like [Lytechinus variegatus]|uniref:ras-related protein Rab-8B-like n=1 Tax=Lytechinus variegatus TaxID=7654 RepID=UPI001BB1E272|nr:ras-related protein Rab-8B-like [Lytechinus variegatus]
MNWQQCHRPRSMSTPYPHICPPVDDPADFSFKIIVIGDSCVGKTSFINMFCEHVFKDNHTGTIGMDLNKRIIDIDGKKIRLHVWDTAGQERFRTLTTAYYRGATGIIILYDVTRESSFDNVTKWLEDVSRNVCSDTCKVLVGNKSDCTRVERVPIKRAVKLSESFDFPYIEASAKTGENVEKVFETITRQMIERYNKKMNTNRPLPPRPTTTEKIELLAKKKSAFSVCSC